MLKSLSMIRLLHNSRLGGFSEPTSELKHGTLEQQPEGLPTLLLTLTGRARISALFPGHLKQLYCLRIFIRMAASISVGYLMANLLKVPLISGCRRKSKRYMRVS